MNDDYMRVSAYKSGKWDGNAGRPCDAGAYWRFKTEYVDGWNDGNVERMHRDMEDAEEVRRTLLKMKN